MRTVLCVLLSGCAATVAPVTVDPCLARNEQSVRVRLCRDEVHAAVMKQQASLQACLVAPEETVEMVFADDEVATEREFEFDPNALVVQEAVVHYVITPTGAVADVDVTGSTNAVLECTRRVLAEWKFEPTVEGAERVRFVLAPEIAQAANDR